MINPDFKAAKHFIYALTIGSCCLVLLFSMISFDQTIAANGKIVADEKLIFMQPQHTATIKKIFVKRGQYVQKDQPLLLLDNTLNHLQANKLQAELAIANNKLHRLNDEIIFLKNNTLPVQAADDQAELQTLRLSINDKVHAIFLLQQELSLQGRHVQLISAQIKDAEKLNQMHEKLYLKKFVSVHQLLTSRQQLRLEQMQWITEKMAYHKLMTTKEEKTAQLNEFKSEQLTILNIKKIDLQQQQRQLINNLAANHYLTKQSMLPAPLSGYILAITALAPGSSITSGQTYIQIAPVAALQNAEVYLTADQIGWIKLNQIAILTLNALSTQQQVDLIGTITNIAPQPIKLNNREYYLVQIKIPRPQLKKLPSRFHLQAGMPVRVYFKVGKMRLINYFIYPLLQQMKEL